MRDPRCRGVQLRNIPWWRRLRTGSDPDDTTAQPLAARASPATTDEAGLVSDDDELSPVVRRNTHARTSDAAKVRCFP